MSVMDWISNFIQAFHHDIQSIVIDPQLLHFYQIGLVIGILLTATLTWFPGKPLGIAYGQGAFRNGVERESEKVEPALGTSASTWPGDQIPKKDLDKLQKKYKLTNDQMQQVMETSKKEFRGHPITGDARAFHDRLNMIVYILIIAVLVYVINRDYNHYVSFWFARYFPSEARTLGMFVPEPKSRGQ